MDPLYIKFPYNSPFAFSENRVIDGIELEGLEVFTNITSQRFQNDLNSIISNEDVLHQGNTSWCGAVAAVYLASTLDGPNFSMNTNNLFQKGYVEGGWFALDLDASDDLYGESPDGIWAGTGMNNCATFIAATTFKNEYRPLNGLGCDLDADEYNSEFWGITYPEDIISYLTTYHDITYKEGDGKYDFAQWGVIDLACWSPITEIKGLLDEGYTPLAIVDNSFMNGGGVSITSQHYIVIKSIEEQSNGNFKATFFNPNGGIDSKEFTKEQWEGAINWYGGFKGENNEK